MELLFEVVLGAFLIFFMVQSAALSTRTVTGDSLTAKGVPLIIAGLALLFLVIMAVQYSRNCKKEGKPLFGDLHIPKQVLLVAAALLVYVILVNKLGFIICTLLYAYGNARLLGYKTRWKVALFAVVLTVLFTVVFAMLFGVPLPRGTGFIRELTYNIY
ncbi:MAG: tripartite tricarboxylate transporter TctB family protein [Clostridia bacterium]|nr:tripartite tricarboxylate transporter TctB family protein [Clostridia bacterium]